MKKHLISATAIAFTCAATSVFADITDFGQGTQIGRYQVDLELSKKAKKHYRKFIKNARYFGAFAFNPQTDNIFAVYDFHNLKTARDSAMEGCRQLTDAPGCVLIAVAMPESLPIATKSASGLSEGAADAFNTVYQENRQPGKFAAFAISGAGNYGYGNAWDTPAYAKDTAVAYCQSGVARDMIPIDPPGRAWVRARGMDTCRIVDLEQMPAE